MTSQTQTEPTMQGEMVAEFNFQKLAGILGAASAAALERLAESVAKQNEVIAKQGELIHKLQSQVRALGESQSNPRPTPLSLEKMPESEAVKTSEPAPSDQPSDQTVNPSTE